MEAIYDREGCAVGWRKRMAIFDTAGKPRAFISQRGLFTYDGRYRGRLEDGWYRDADGLAVAFENGASGGPMRPMIQKGAVAPLPDADPPPPAVTVPPPPRIRSSNWSKTSWEKLLGGTAVGRKASKG